MPQINRIRVNNVKYNFGTQSYDDFVMRFSCRNSIYDLANGGGKSVLMLLLMQNMIPNCTLDDKQPIEKLFRQGNDNTTIHSLVEWKLDACDMKDGYQYMTTGFCARKGHETGENAADKNTAAIEYFNYCIFYREFGEHDIKNLPLTKDGERITYNGLKSYLRDLPKRDYGVSVQIFERKGDYQSFITQYGLYESQWEIIRGINRTEGHVRTYFETNYKTTRKVIEDLLIEGIIEKSYNNRIGNGDDDGMAQTLLKIKDQLMELAKRKGEMNRYDEQMELLTGFAEKLESLKALYRTKKETEATLLNYLMAVKVRLGDKEDGMSELASQLEALTSEEKECNRMIAAAEIAVDEADLSKVNDLIESTKNQVSAMQERIEKLSENLRMAEIAADFADYEQCERQILELQEMIAGNATEQDAVETMKRLAATKALLVAPQITADTEQLTAMREEKNRLSEAQNRALEAKEETFAKLHETEGRKQVLGAKEKSLDDELGLLMHDLEMAVSAGLPAKKQEYSEKLVQAGLHIQQLKESIGQNTERSLGLQGEAARIDAQMAILAEEIAQLETVLATRAKEQAKLEKMKSIYGGGSNESVKQTIVKIREDVAKSLYAENLAQAKLRDALASYEEGRLPQTSQEVQTVLSYLQGRYEKVRTGRELLDALSQEEALAAVKENPLLPYAIVAGADYDEIIADKTLMKLDTGAVIVPILPLDTEGKLVSHEQESNLTYAGSGKFAGSFIDYGFLYKESERRSVCATLREDLHHVSEQVAKLADRLQVLDDDLLFLGILGNQAGDSIETVTERYNERVMKKDALAVRRGEIDEELAVVADKDAKLARAVADEEHYAQDCQNSLDKVLRAIGLEEELHATRAKKRDADNDRNDCSREYHRITSELRDLEMKLQELGSREDAIAKRLAQVKEEFARDFGSYASTDALPYEDMEEQEVDAKAGALREKLAGREGDLADKERLLASYQDSKKKAENQIRYRGMSIEDARAAYAEGRLIVLDLDAQIAAKENIENERRLCHSVEDSLEAQNAHKNRLEGGIAHATNQYETRFGTYQSTEIANPADYIRSHREELDRLRSQRKNLEASVKKVEAENKEFLLMEKDLTRIIRNAGLAVPEIVMATANKEELARTELSAELYEKTQHRYEQLLREENKKRSAFADEKGALIDALKKLEAFELAEEIRLSLVMPQQEADVEVMVQGLRDTNDCIALERDSIEQGIADMERIKDSFEERCIQICSNIRSELDRLPKLSRITMEEELLPMITLTIPYIKDELYKDRMSNYINETISGAELLATPDEKLKYIRNKLSWKKLFSVIVTDMNSIKLCLYKREHIKEQSRYLRYEEAVGSTGQSQGIYIQFLIAMIHYISSINAVGKDNGVTCKTIFIDNPFGAAKDVYIWEPIFQLLKTNHVQLIVPARGATPAITGMFDVNYVLGQKMTGSRLQTVVVDYHSQINTEAMDYEVLEYTQATLNLD